MGCQVPHARTVLVEEEEEVDFSTTDLERFMKIYATDLTRWFKNVCHDSFMTVGMSHVLHWAEEKEESWRRAWRGSEMDCENQRVGKRQSNVHLYK